MSERPLTEQMQQYLAALHHCGSVKGFGFGVSFDSTRKSLVKRGLLVRLYESGRVVHALTPAGKEVAKSLPDPRSGPRGESLQRRLEEVRAGKW